MAMTVIHSLSVTPLVSSSSASSSTTGLLHSATPSRLSLGSIHFSSVYGSPYKVFHCPIPKFSRYQSTLMTSAIKAYTSQELDADKVIPQADRVLVKLEELPEKSTGGVLLPKAAVKFEHYLCGEVLSAGKEVEGIQKGQKVLFSDINAYEVNIGNTKKFCFVKAGDLLAVVE